MLSTESSTAPLTSEGVTAWSAAAGEPSFLTERRLQALAQYLATPMPGRRDETWRRVDLGGLNIDAAAVRAPAEGLVELSPPSAEARARGVFWGTPAEAAKAVPDVLQRHWATEVFPAGAALEVGDGRKFRALNQALWDCGYVCHVPRGVEVELPARAEFRTRPGEDGIFPHNLVVLDEGASATVIESYVSHTAGKGLCCPQTEVLLGVGARLRYILLQATGPEVVHIGAHRAHQYADSRLTLASAHLGSRLEKSFLGTRLLAPRARANLSGLYCGTGAQKLHLDTLQHHVAPECASDLLYKGALGGHARGVYRGMIHLEPGAQKTDAYQRNRALLLSDAARIDSIPGLEILANDVRCSHGATAGQVDPEMMFYLMSRGLPRLEARRMIIDGFLDEVLRRFALEAVIAPLRELVDGKLGHETGAASAAAA
ncbi:MAG: Fe-S cluster assembly protein SufD [Planctomycetota bacterium]|nr:Fe-S cluster assembly protein SufD [Planctomycetota bacterium]